MAYVKVEKHLQKIWNTNIPYGWQYIEQSHDGTQDKDNIMEKSGLIYRDRFDCEHLYIGESARILVRG